MLKIDSVNVGFLESHFLDLAKKTLDGIKNREIEKEAGFIALDEKNDVEKIKKYVKKTKDDFESIVILGIGGSILGTKAVFEAIKGENYNELTRKKRKDCPKIYFLENVDPTDIKNVLDVISLKKTLFIVVSKSGTTLETVSLYDFFASRIEKKGLDLKKHFVFVCGENTEFASKQEKAGFKVFLLPENVGGRFSVLSNVGLLPLAFVGIDIEKLLKGQTNYKKIFFEENLIKNIALFSALLEYNSYKENKNITIFMPYTSSLKSLARWYRQLFNESLGKDGIGSTLVNSTGVTEQHGDLQLYLEGPKDKLIIFLEIEKFNKDYKIIPGEKKKFSDLMHIEKYGTERSLSEAKVSNYTIKIDKLDEETLGELIFFFEMQIYFLGELFKVNVFNQPGVAIGKKIANDKLKEKFGE